MWGVPNFFEEKSCVKAVTSPHTKKPCVPNYTMVTLRNPPKRKHGSLPPKLYLVANTNEEVCVALASSNSARSQNANVQSANNEIFLPMPELPPLFDDEILGEGDTADKINGTLLSPRDLFMTSLLGGGKSGQKWHCFSHRCGGVHFSQSNSYGRK